MIQFYLQSLKKVLLRTYTTISVITFRFWFHPQVWARAFQPANSIKETKPKCQGNDYLQKNPHT